MWESLWGGKRDQMYLHVRMNRFKCLSILTGFMYLPSSRTLRADLTHSVQQPLSFTLDTMTTFTSPSIQFTWELIKPDHNFISLAINDRDHCLHYQDRGGMENEAHGDMGLTWGRTLHSHTHIITAMNNGGSIHHKNVSC